MCCNHINWSHVQDGCRVGVAQETDSYSRLRFAAHPRRNRRAGGRGGGGDRVFSADHSSVNAVSGCCGDGLQPGRRGETWRKKARRRLNEATANYEL